MRTTVRLDDALLAEAKATAGRTGRTLTQVMEDALRESLGRRNEPRNPLSEADIPTFAGSGLQPGVDLDNTASLLELMNERATR
ncbi:MAG: type II toxin-antitoxin system VapB family antitoxin [Candidatus Dormibacteria bacterium]